MCFEALEIEISLLYISNRLSLHLYSDGPHQAHNFPSGFNLFISIVIKLSFISPSLMVHALLVMPYLFLQSSESFGTKRVTIPHLSLALDRLPEELKNTVFKGSL